MNGASLAPGNTRAPWGDKFWPTFPPLPETMPDEAWERVAAAWMARLLAMSPPAPPAPSAT